MKDYPLEKYKFYIHGNRVIAVSTYSGRTVRGVAVCAEGDSFDVEKGKELAAARCNMRIAEKRAARAHKKWNEAALACGAAEAHYEKMNDYYDDALEAYDIALQAVEALEAEF